MGDTTAQTRFESVSKHSNDLLLARGNTLQSDEDRMKLNELIGLCITLPNRVLELEKIKTSQYNEIASLNRRVKKLKKRNRSRTHKLERLYKVGLTVRVESSDDEESLGREEVCAAAWQNENVVNITTKELTLAQVLEALKTSKPKVKGLLFKSQIKSGLMKKLLKGYKLNLMRKKDLQGNKLKKQEANIALIETWNDIQAKIDVDYQLVERLQAQEQEELSDAKKATLIQQLLEKRRKHFAAKRA
nr:hypothetical protein [Tanacetum cinerariifolium]